MSFRVDLWNGIDLIKNQYNSTHKRLKSLIGLLTSYISYEADYCRNLELLYREYKDISKPEFLIDVSFQKIIEIFNNECQLRKALSNYITKNIIEPVNSFLAIPKTKYNKFFSDFSENKSNFNKSITILLEKQNLFHTQCKELGSYIAQMEMDTLNKTNRTNKSKLLKILEKTKNEKEEYLNCLKETNGKREIYNLKTEEILNGLEEMYTTLVEKLQQSLFNFSKKRVIFLKKLYEKEQKEHDEIHSKIVPKNEILDFIIKNATKEFPFVKFEFCPIKYSSLNKYIKDKYSKIPKEELPKIYKSIQNYLDNNEIFKDEIIFKINKKQYDFFTRRISFFSKKVPQIDNNETKVEKTELQKNKEFLEKYLTDLFRGNRKPKTKEIKKEESKEENIEKKEDHENNPQANNSKEENKIENEDNKKPTEKKEKDNMIQENIDFLNQCNININAEKKENEKKEENGKNNEKKDFEEVEKLIKNKNINNLFFVEVLIKKLSYLRSKGIFEIDENAYKTVLLLFDIIMDENPKNDYILKNVLILCNTFYKLEGKEKIYLQEGIKNRNIFSDPETWHRVINYSMMLNNTEKDLNNIKINETIEKIKKECDVVVISYLCDIIQFTDDEKVFNDVKNYYIKVYNIDENKINNQIENYKKAIKNKNNNKDNNKEKDEIKGETKDKNIDIKDNNGDTNDSTNNISNDNSTKEENKKEINDLKNEIKDNTIIESEIKENKNNKSEEKDLTNNNDNNTNINNEINKEENEVNNDNKNNKEEESNFNIKDEKAFNEIINEKVNNENKILQKEEKMENDTSKINNEKNNEIKINDNIYINLDTNVINKDESIKNTNENKDINIKEQEI